MLNFLFANQNAHPVPVTRGLSPEMQNRPSDLSNAEKTVEKKGFATIFFRFLQDIDPVEKKEQPTTASRTSPEVETDALAADQPLPGSSPDGSFDFVESPEPGLSDNLIETDETVVFHGEIAEKTLLSDPDNPVEAMALPQEISAWNLRQPQEKSDLSQRQVAWADHVHPAFERPTVQAGGTMVSNAPGLSQNVPETGFSPDFGKVTLNHYSAEAARRDKPVADDAETVLQVRSAQGVTHGKAAENLSDLSKDKSRVFSRTQFAIDDAVAATPTRASTSPSMLWSDHPETVSPPSMANVGSTPLGHAQGWIEADFKQSDVMNGTARHAPELAYPREVQFQPAEPQTRGLSSAESALAQTPGIAPTNAASPSLSPSVMPSVERQSRGREAQVHDPALRHVGEPPVPSRIAERSQTVEAKGKRLDIPPATLSEATDRKSRAASENLTPANHLLPTRDAPVPLKVSEKRPSIEQNAIALSRDVVRGAGIEQVPRQPETGVRRDESPAAPGAILPVTADRQPATYLPVQPAVFQSQMASLSQAGSGARPDSRDIESVELRDTVRFAAGAAIADPLGHARASLAGQPNYIDLPRNVAQQLAASMRGGAEMSAELHLSPSELGRVRISLSSSDAGMIVSIHADRPETLELMRRHADELAREFHDIGYQAAEFSFGQNMSDRPSRDDPASERAGSVTALEPPERPGTVDSLLPRPRIALDRVDLRV